MSGMIKAWSFSRYGDYESCPQKAKFKHILRIAEPGNDAMLRGTLMHRFAELYVHRKRITFAATLEGLDPRDRPRVTQDLFRKVHAEWRDRVKLLADEFAELRKYKDGLTEDSWTFTKGWEEECAWDDWNRAWIRLKIDYHRLDPETNRVLVIDYKTGRIRDSHRDQLSLYAIAALLIYPEAVGVDTELWYLDQGVTQSEAFERKALPRIRKMWDGKVKPMLNDRRFAPRPGNHCRWCHYRKENKENGGGQCEF